MKRKLTTFMGTLGGCAALVIGSAACAADPAAPTDKAARGTTTRSNTVNPSDATAPVHAPIATHTWRTSQLEKMTVRNNAGEKIGAIQDLVITPDGRVAYAALGFGGFLGWDEKLFAVPWQDLHIHLADARYSDNHIVLNVTKEELKDTPGFDKANWPNFADPNFTRTIDTYYQNRRPMAQGWAPPKNGLSQDLTKVSKEGYGAFRAIHLARIAIFNGDTKLAQEMLGKAKTDLDAATQDAHAFAVHAKAADHGEKTSEKPANGKMDLIPIDGEIAIADTFVPSDEKKRHIESANEHLKSGRSKEALEELRLGEVDVVFARLMLPLESTKKRVADAEKLANDHKWYEANLALKAAEGGLIIESVDLLGSPVASPAAPAAKVSKK